LFPRFGQGGWSNVMVTGSAHADEAATTTQKVTNWIILFMKDPIDFMKDPIDVVLSTPKILACNGDTNYELEGLRVRLTKTA
jgi:hypothetical protein